MGRKPKIRVNFNSDSSYLLRLASAVAEDTSLDADWRTDTASRCQALAAHLLTAKKVSDGA